ncbi:MAG: RHS repeat-associated core domain-containing protein [Arenimonas sp.]
MSGFTYGNGIIHSLTQNARFLPLRSKDMNGTTAVLDDTYVYDANGNIASITDGTAGNGGNRSMTYDNADRLIQTSAPNQWWISNVLAYDALDNIRVNTLGNRTHNYQYNATTQRLDLLTLPNASVARNIAYDAAGNVTTNGAQTYVFDKANRMQSVSGLESYVYDGHGRRVKITRLSDNKISYPIYSLDGKIVADEDQRSNKTNDYIYLNGSLVAKRSAPIGTTTYTTSYQHTDSLGSPVAETDAVKTVSKIERYTPYGEPSDNGYDQGPGYTSHVTDAATGLTYAQQRYYDPVIGKFLSADPVETDPNTGIGFNRYAYANNNPYKFIDPDGRKNALGIIAELPQSLTNPSSKDLKVQEAAQRSVDLTVDAIQRGNNVEDKHDASVWVVTVDPRVQKTQSGAVADTIAYKDPDTGVTDEINTLYSASIYEAANSNTTINLTYLTADGGDAALAAIGAHEISHGTSENQALTELRSSERNASDRALKILKNSNETSVRNGVRNCPTCHPKP